MAYNKYSLKDKKLSFSDLINAPKAILEPFMKLATVVVDFICEKLGKGVDWLASLFTKTNNSEAVKTKVDQYMNGKDTFAKAFGDSVIAEEINNLDKRASVSSPAKSNAVFAADTSASQASYASWDDVLSKMNLGGQNG